MHVEDQWNYVIKSEDGLYYHFHSGSWRPSVNKGCLFSESGCLNLVGAVKRYIEQGVVDAGSLFVSAEVIRYEEEL